MTLCDVCVMCMYVCVYVCDTAKVPFPLTLRFKAMLQRGIELQTLSASWLVT